MRVIVNKEEMEAALRDCYQLIKRLQAAPIYNCVRIADNDGLQVEAFNGQERLIVHLDGAQMLEGATCCLSCGMLWRSLQGSKAERVTININEAKLVATATGQDMRATLYCLNPAEFPKLDDGRFDSLSQFVINSGDFAAMLKRIAKAQAEGGMGDMFEGIHFCTNTDGLLICEAYDKRRAHVQTTMVPVNGKALDVMVPSGTIETLRALLQSAGTELELAVTFDDHKIAVSFPAMEYRAPLMHGQVPSVSAKIPAEADKK